MASQRQLQAARPPAPEQAEWRRRFDARWGLSRRGIPLPADGDWRARCALKPFERNLLRNPNPEGVNISEPAPPCPPDAPCQALDYAGLFEYWEVSIEPLPATCREVPAGTDSLSHSWCVKQQCVDLLAEGLWAELLDLYQPSITVLDWYEDSKLAGSVYELHVQLLGTDRATAIGEFHYVAREGEAGGENKGWHNVSHVFQRYGPGVRHVRFLHKTRDAETLAGLLRTRATDSSVSVQLRD
ncbi:F-box only protein 50 [Varanus komodoensis]|uniref:F-box only protein 50 n=1 Tax=Varanus komodoensis TaxID=61221 RepID=UPI001CF78D0D|nr:F-box only protein 50 [Varanus komodoensis]KAF7242247.1 F-box only protein 50 [Varanus komodoensis]